ncbi:hypothetical protein DXG03_007606 [Asterophora parasitica]|uniref:Uncharacterized protein n=1 Tax=Asterophora parasitica TaxID=117018 RepID=A0A9P7K6X7_9AGAR|nr:hypothetical protein DXG03_007606 [Asterophora parasitica]
MRRVLLNTSGAGKTRLVLEGLCFQWGLYFTCRSSVDNIGSSDIQNITGYKVDFGERPGYLRECGKFTRDVPLDHPERKALLDHNSEYADHFFQAAITARLLSFLIFLDAAQSSNRVDKNKLWTLVQIDTRLLAWDDKPFADLFSELTTVLCHAEPEMLRKETVHILAACLKHINSPTLYCVLDEAQTAAEMLPKAFSSASKTSPKHRPVLRTSLNQDVVADALSSTVGKAPNLQKGITDVGEPFSSADVRLHLEKYLSAAYIESIHGGELIRRACYWLTGRPRFTASYIEFLLHHGLISPHRVLTKYITHLTKFTPNDGEAWEQMEGELTCERYAPRPFDFERIEDSDISDLADAVQRLAYYRLTSGRLSFEEDGVMTNEQSTQLVQSGFARFPKPGSTSQEAVIDEPLAYLAAEYWIATRTVRTKRHDWYAKRFLTSTLPNTNGLELYVLSCLADIFSSYKLLSEIFTFSPRGRKTDLWTRRARLVTRWIDSSGENRFAPVCFPFQVEVEGGSLNRRLTSASNILGFCSQVKNPDTETGDSDLEWLRGYVNALFLLPLKNFGPDLIMCLQLEPLQGGIPVDELIWVKTDMPFSPKSNHDLVNNTAAALADLQVTFCPTPLNSADHMSMDIEGDTPMDTPMEDAESTRDEAMEGVKSSEPCEQYPLLRVICTFPAEPTPKDCDTILQENPFDSHDLAWLPFSSYEAIPGAHCLKRYKDANALSRQMKSEAGKAPPALQKTSDLYDALDPFAKKIVREELSQLKPMHQLASLDMTGAQEQQSTKGKVRNPKKYSFGPLPRPKNSLREWRKVLLRAAQTYQGMFGMTTDEFH